VTASNLVKVNLAGDILDRLALSNYPAGFTIHSAIHAVSPRMCTCGSFIASKATIGVATIERGLTTVELNMRYFFSLPSAKLSMAMRLGGQLR